MFSFTKMQATGNDFILINYLENRLEYSYKLLAQFLCDRHYGVGADGILIIEKSDIADFKMRIFNQDGSEAEMCGNGIRCFAKYVFEKKLINKQFFNIETLAGIKLVSLDIEGENVTAVEVDMGKPMFELENIPVIYLENNYKGKIYIENLEVYPVSVGNPHAVCFVENLDNFDIERYGKLIEDYKYFPNKTNVEFAKILDEEHVKVRVWERGVGETLSCGTGACAVSVVSNKYKEAKNNLIIDLLGGTLKINCSETIKLKGPAEIVFEGKILI